MADGVSHSTINRAYAVTTVTILYKGDEPDLPGMYFQELKETNEMLMMIWDGEELAFDKAISKDAYNIILDNSGYK